MSLGQCDAVAVRGALKQHVEGTLGKDTVTDGMQMRVDQYADVAEWWDIHNVRTKTWVVKLTQGDCHANYGRIVQQLGSTALGVHCHCSLSQWTAYFDH
jgi:hypothetical protein